MSILKSSDDHLTLNADGSGKAIKFQADGVEKASINSSGLLTSTTIDATALTGNLPAIDGSNLTGISAGTALTGSTNNTIPTVTGANAISGEANLTFDGTDLTLGTGNLVIGTSGKGIDFSATSDGTTMSSELLDDYEEGTWTPTITCSTSGSYTVDTGANALAYTKVGRVVHIQGGVNIASESSPNGNIRMSLPFTPFSGTKDSDYCMGNAMLTNHGGSLPNNADLFISGADYASLFSVADDGGTQYLDHDDVDTAFTIIFSMTYIAS